MANVTVNGQNYTGVNEVRLPVTNGDGTQQSFVLPPSGTKSITANGSGIDVADYAAVNVNVPTGITPTGTKNITTNGDYDVTQYAGAHVAVPASEIRLQNKTVTQNGNVTADAGYDGLGTVTVNVPSDTPQTQEKTVVPSTSQQVVTPDSGKLLSKVTVSAIQTETKSATPSASAQQITPTSGKYLTRVDVAGDANLVSGNIKNGVSIFGVNGSYSGGGSTVQTYSGTFSTNSNGIATLNCGFAPDLIFIDTGVYTYSGETAHGTVALPLFADQINPVDSIGWGNPINVDTQIFYRAYNRTSTGCTITQLRITGNWSVLPMQTSNTAYTAYKFL